MFCCQAVPIRQSKPSAEFGIPAGKRAQNLLCTGQPPLQRKSQPQAKLCVSGFQRGWSSSSSSSSSSQPSSPPDASSAQSRSSPDSDDSNTTGCCLVKLPLATAARSPFCLVLKFKRHFLETQTHQAKGPWRVRPLSKCPTPPPKTYCMMFKMCQEQQDIAQYQPTLSLHMKTWTDTRACLDNRL